MKDIKPSCPFGIREGENVRYSKATLLSWKKENLINYIATLENNLEAKQFRIENQRQYIERLRSLVDKSEVQNG